jgi:hypothetical protein
MRKYTLKRVKIFAKTADRSHKEYAQNAEESTGNNRKQATKKSGRYFFKIKTYIRKNKIL